MKGNRKEQRKRYKKMIKSTPRAPDEYLLIDGNWSHYACYYCRRKQGYLTKGLVNTHKCKQRKCNMLESVLI